MKLLIKHLRRLAPGAQGLQMQKAEQAIPVNRWWLRMFIFTWKVQGFCMPVFPYGDAKATC